MIDVLIIGSGGAGLSAALEAKDLTNKVTVVTKNLPTNSQTSQAQGGINAVLYEDNDSIEEHIEDTYKGSKELGNKEHIKYLCKTAKESVEWLDLMGVPFNRDKDNNISQRRFGGTKKIRTCYSSDYTGLKILHTLYDQCVNKDINFLTEHFTLELIVQNNKCIGVVLYDIENGEIKELYAKSIILATGGYAGIYNNHTTNSTNTTGDGIMLAYKAGAKLSNLEFVQFHPTTLKGSNILISESARGEGGYLVDKDSNRFIDELKTRDEIARAIYNKIDEGKEIFLDLRHLGKEKILKLLPQEYELAKLFSNIQLDSELLPINPSAHYTMGGIKTKLNGETNISNLFACGECAQVDIHGANRLGGNSLLEIVTLGKLAGKTALENSKLNALTFKEKDLKIRFYIKYFDKLLNKKNIKSFYKSKEFLSKELFKNLGLFRDEQGITTLLNSIELLIEELNLNGIDDKSTIYNKNLIDYLEYKNILELSQLVALSALNRKESRGSHYRTDYNHIDNNYSKNSIVEFLNKHICFEEI